jgi:hypothetical protein
MGREHVVTFRKQIANTAFYRWATSKDAWLESCSLG